MIEPQNLSKEGIKFWNSLTDQQKERQYYLAYHLCSYHFKSYEDYERYKKELKVSVWRTRLLENVDNPESIDKQFLDNLSNILSDMNDELEDLDCKKQNVKEDW